MKTLEKRVTGDTCFTLFCSVSVVDFQQVNFSK